MSCQTEESPIVVEVPQREQYCPRCSNGRVQIRPGGGDYRDVVPCQLCRPQAYAEAMGFSTS